MPTGPHGSSQPDGKYRSYGRKVSLFALFLAAYSSHVMEAQNVFHKSLADQQLEYSLWNGHVSIRHPQAELGQ